MLVTFAGCSNSEDEKEVQPTETPKTLQIVDTYDYGESVPSCTPQEESYLSTCAFIGDSRIGALSLYEACKESEIAFVSALNLMRIDTMQVDGVSEKETLVDVLDQTSKKNIYLLFGINEIRNIYFDSFKEAYGEIIKGIQTKHPDSNVYLILNYHPDRISGMSDEEINTQLDKLNTCVTQLAIEHKVYMLNLDEGMDSENGRINEAYVSDGLHLNRDGAKAFESFILSHVVDKESYMKEMYV